MKKLTQGEVGQLLMSAIKQKHYHEELRLGQSITIEAKKLFPEWYLRLSQTGADCFYNDNKIQSFIEAISE